MCRLEQYPCDVWKETRRAARKRHRCCCCYADIKIGQVYLAHFDVYEGEANNEKCCLDCDADRQVFASAHAGALSTPWWFPDVLQECVGEDAESEREWGPMWERIRARRLAARAAKAANKDDGD